MHKKYHSKRLQGNVFTGHSNFANQTCVCMCVHTYACVSVCIGGVTQIGPVIVVYKSELKMGTNMHIVIHETPSAATTLLECNAAICSNIRTMQTASDNILTTKVVLKVGQTSAEHTVYLL